MIIVLSATAGGMIFGEFEGMPSERLVVFWLGGVLVTMFGLAILAVFQARRNRELEATAEEGEDKKATSSTSAAAEPSQAQVVVVDVEVLSAYPGAPPGYVPDPRCYFCGIRMPCMALW